LLSRRWLARTEKLLAPATDTGRWCGASLDLQLGFWSVTVYDTKTRSEIDSGQGHAALRSLFELKNAPSGKDVELRFGPTEPAALKSEWIKTIPGKRWFVYFRIYGPEKPAFDGSWQSGDFEKVV
jgi:hypothetical protein